MQLWLKLSKLVTKDADLKEAFFTTPVALAAARGTAEPSAKWQRPDWKGSAPSSKGIGFSVPKGPKGKGKQSKGDKELKGFNLFWRTSDGRDICFAY